MRAGLFCVFTLFPELCPRLFTSLCAVCQALLPLPQTAAKAAAAASNKQRAAAEESIAAAVGDVLHLIGALKDLLPLMTGESSRFCKPGG